MQVKAIKVSAGRTFNHPYESYSNLRCDVHLDATLDEGEDAHASVRALQNQAEELAEDHKQTLLKQLHSLEKLSRTKEEIGDLEDRIGKANARLLQLRHDATSFEDRSLSLAASDREERDFQENEESLDP